MNESTLLQNLGLTPVESAIYLALINSGPTSIRSVAQAAATNRGTAYEALKRLSILGLVMANRKGERYRYRAESPESIYRLIADQRQALQSIEQAATDIVPGLMAQSEHRQGEPLVRFYEDDEGIATILRDVLHTVSALPHRQYYAYSSRLLRKYLYRRFPAFTRQRIAGEIAVRVIAVGEGGELADYAQRKWLPEPSMGGLSSYTLIYGPKVAHISISGDDTPYGVVIEEPGSAAMQRLLFEELWQRLDTESISRPNATSKVG